MIVDARRGEFIHLLDVFDNSQHRPTHFFACPSTPWDQAKFEITSPEPRSFSICPAEIRDPHTFFFRRRDYCSVYIRVEYIPITLDQETSWLLQINLFHIDSRSCFLQDILLSSTYTDRNRPCWRCTNQAFPGWYSLLAIFQKNFFRTASPMAIQQVSVRTDSVRGKPLVLQYCAMTSATCAVVDVSMCLDI